MRPRGLDFARALLRSFSVQGAWNRHTMTAPGLAHAMRPLLARIFAGDAEALRAAIERHASAFNAHPYLTPVAIGALARLEHDGEDAEVVTRFRSALRAPLGAVGDELVWAGWRPFCAAAAAAGFMAGLDPMLAAALFLVVFNLGHVWLRVWGLRIGWRAGRGIAGALLDAPLRRVSGILLRCNPVLLGLLATLLVAGPRGLSASPWIGLGAVIAGLIGYLAPRHVSRAAVATLFAACLAWLL